MQGGVVMATTNCYKKLFVLLFAIISSIALTNFLTPPSLERILSHSIYGIPTNEIYHTETEKQRNETSAENVEHIGSAEYFCKGKKPHEVFAFVKVHKCASDSLAVNFMRLAEERNSEIILPRGKWNLNWPYKPGGFHLSTKESGKFDVQALHMMFDLNTWKNLMESNVKYIAIIRYPYWHFKSYFNYMGLAKNINKNFDVPIEETLDFFLKNTTETTEHDRKRNRMLFDFGFKGSNDDAEPYVRFLENHFSLVLIQDYLDESMLLLKHEMCWSLRDVMLKKINTLGKSYVYGPKRDSEVIERSREENYKEYAGGDYLLFDAFNRTLWKKIDQVEDFALQLEEYRNISAKVGSHCEQKGIKPSMRINSVLFKEKIDIDGDFCIRYNTGVLGYIKRLKLQRHIE